ncbi:hypothetical protein UFOVP264_6 [uncultured Caudovirales phage]|uniref:Uncharacterized protein n=1 Tax=uncultured Caudovirales phage TaxID=2100421 RepID=A0A6J5LKV8_9CAUD|nr:hypothetical protein UFOVP264_6 [uncultured Caudovirales phage]
MPFTIVTQGTFTQPSTAVNQYIPLPSGADYFTTTNLTQMNLAPNPGVCVRGEWYGGGLTADNDGLRWTKTLSTNAINIDKFSTATASNGFTYVRSFPQPQAQLTGTTITNATPAVATVTNTYSEGDQVTIYNAVGLQQISGMTFTISSVSGSGFTLLGLNSPGSAATSFKVRRVAPAEPVQPQFYFITGITQATQGVVTVSQKHNYVVGQTVEFQIPGSCGMVQLNNFNQPQSLPAKITAVTDYTFTINVNTTNFTAFALPASSGSPTAQLFPTVAPQGQNAQFNPITNVTTGYNFTQVPFHSSLFIPYMIVPAGAQSPGGAAGDIIVWQAFKMETGTINSPVPS